MLCFYESRYNDVGRTGPFSYLESCEFRGLLVLG